MKQVFNIKGIVMNEDFVSFSLAKKLKKKGFYRKCVSTYDNDGMLGYNYIQPTSIRAIGFDDCLCSHNVENDDCIDAPTISQVLKWLREEKNIHIGFGYIPRKKWRHVVMYMDDRFYNKPTLAVDGFLKIEQAAIAGIEYVIDNLI